MWDISRSYQRVGIEGLELYVRVGAYAAERAAAQRVTVDVELFRHAGAHRGGGLKACLDYDRVYRHLVEEWPRRDHTDLLEELAEDVVAVCLEDERVEACRVIIRKPDVYDGPAVPALEIFRRRDGC